MEGGKNIFRTLIMAGILWSATSDNAAAQGVVNFTNNPINLVEGEGDTKETTKKKEIFYKEIYSFLQNNSNVKKFFQMNGNAQKYLFDYQGNRFFLRREIHNGNETIYMQILPPQKDYTQKNEIDLFQRIQTSKLTPLEEGGQKIIHLD